MASKKTQLLLFFFLFLLSPPIISFSLPTEFSILNQTPSEDNLLSEDPVVDLFQQWMGKYGKVYNHPGEFEIRLENFRTNFNYVTEKNAQRRGYSVGLNTFADMSNEEFKQKFSSKIKKPVNTIKVGNQEEHLLKCDAPPSLDWRQKGAVTGVKNQGICGSSCWAFSATGAIEGINAIKTGNLISVSEQELIDCDKTNDGCSGGYMDNALQWVVDNGGINTEADYPYTANNDKCNTAKKDKKIVTIDGIGEVVPQTESKLFCAVVNQPVSVGIQGSSLDFMLYTGGIFDGYCCSGNPEDINHAVLIVGYASSGDKDYWIVKNSWGTSWGMEGYGYIKRNTNLEFGVCAINSRASYPTKQSVSPPSPDPSPPPLKPQPDNWCDLWYYCPVDQTCCCTFSFLGICYIYNCCHYENAVCCYGKPYCCPYFNPICDTKNHRCLQSHDDKIGIPAKKMKTAELKLPWTKYEEAEDQCPLEEKRNHLASVY